MKIYTRPDHILDTAFIVFKLDGDQLSLERHPVSLQFDDCTFLKSIEGFNEIDNETFASIASMRASHSSIEEFQRNYQELFG